MPKIRWVEIQGFRAFGAAPRRFEFSTSLQLIWGPNSQGKTSVAEAFEFLLTGGTVRRDLMGSAKAEFNACLRNVHLPADTKVYVAACIEDDRGVLHEVRRTLVSDYTAQDDCTSTLTVYGQPAQNLAPLDIRLSEPPLQAPVLMQHTLRFVMSAPPQERANYFKAILEMQDLETVREEISGLLTAVDAPAPAVLQALRRSEAVPGFGPTARSIEGNALTGRHLEEALAQGLGSVLVTAGFGTDLPQDLAGRIAALRSGMTARREATFPLSALPPEVRGVVRWEEPTLVAVEVFSDASHEVVEEAGKLVQLFRAVLALPHVADAGHPQDCPVCQTPRALTPERIRAIRGQVENLADFDRKRSAALQELADLRRATAGCQRSVQAILPPAGNWDEAARHAHRATVATILPSQGVELYDRYSASVEDLRAKISAAGTKSSDLLAALTGIETEVSEGRVVDTNGANGGAHAYGQALEEAVRAKTACGEAAEALAAPLRGEIDRRANIAGWQELVQLAEAPALLAEALRDQRARDLVRADIEETIRTIDEAKAAVFDEKFRNLSGEIGRWWNHLRPDELVGFGGVRRRGTGRRYVDFKAILRPPPVPPLWNETR